ncbi:hypothetical protein [Streptomyces noursei]|uniref:hypothetical protein n=1 Tax=Streptomyces noursei TaxID=1971 RepID=UPI0016780727|nr:hypothetical protein [Streptomyces noursei]MCZ1016314.1 hypothetical protein [Streptomyces noursei]GGX00607.1 hypothetical protein GCM10010341_22940 [Streptomyces noursei]
MTDSKVFELLDWARQLIEENRPALARLCVEEAAKRISDPREAARIRDEWLGPNHRTGA